MYDFPIDAVINQQTLQKKKPNNKLFFKCDKNIREFGAFT